MEKLNILLITGIVTDEHTPLMNPMIRYMLESTERFKVKITEEFTGCTAETLKKYDAVFINYDGKESIETPFVNWGKTAEEALYEYVKNGGGCVLLHTAIMNPTGESSNAFLLIRLASPCPRYASTTISPELATNCLLLQLSI